MPFLVYVSGPEHGLLRRRAICYQIRWDYVKHLRSQPVTILKLSHTRSFAWPGASSLCFPLSFCLSFLFCFFPSTTLDFRLQCFCLVVHLLLNLAVTLHVFCSFSCPTASSVATCSR
ncbi:hypothetical protein ABW21_db0203312 [Orbilia brochopaga]|nr:hypothetical protein ABW21_db0203312 [Drechslerella brochopaga]